MTKGSRTAVHVILWTGSILIVMIIGIVYFPKESPEIGFWESLYYTLRLFIFEHDLPSFPKSPPLVFIHFFAPMVALSAVGTLISYLIRLSPTFRTKWLKEHVIICGVGRTGKLMAMTLKKRGVPVVGIDIGPPEAFEEWRADYKIPVIFGDFHSRLVLENAGFEGARSIIFASGNDMANFEGAVAAYGFLNNASGKHRILWTHIANEKLANTARLAITTEGFTSIRFFDTYRIAATKMVTAYFNKQIRRGVQEVLLLGFGKFGRDLTEVLIQDQGPEEIWTIKIIDKRDVENEVRSLAEELGVTQRISFQRAVIQDLDFEGGLQKAFFLCTDDDIGNLTVALLLSSHMKCFNIIVRMAAWPLPAIAQHLGRNGISFININELMIEGIENLPGIFANPELSDLRRTNHVA